MSDGCNNATLSASQPSVVCSTRGIEIVNIVFLSPRNDLSGNRKLLTMLASELGKHNSVSILYPIIPDLEFLSHLSQPTNALWYIRKYIADCRHYLKSPRWLYGSLLNCSRISVKPYWSAIPT